MAGAREGHARIGTGAMNRKLIGRSAALSAFLLAIVPLAFIGGVTFFQLFVNAPESRAAREDALRRFEVLQLAASFEEAMLDAERGQRGFLITGQEDYLAPYTEAKASIPLRLAELRRMVGDEPDQSARLADLEESTNVKMNEMATTIAKRRAEGFDQAKAIVETDVGKAAMSAMTDDIEAIQRAAGGRLQQSLDLGRETEERLTSTFLAGSVIASASLMAGALVLARAYGRAAASERILRATLDGVREGVAAFDSNEALLAWNGAFLKLLRAPGQALRKGAVLRADEAAPEAAELIEAIADVSTKARQVQRAAIVDRTCADNRVFEIFASPASGEGHIVTLLDTTDRRRAEEALRQSGKLEALGHMTGGVAHDFNNLLTVVIGSMGMLRKSVGDNLKALERIELVTIAAERGAKLTQQLLAFARRQPLQPDVVNMGALMTESLPLIRRAVGESVEVDCINAGGLWNTRIDASQFQSAVLNLAINARDAMPNGGKLTIEVANMALDDFYAAQDAEVAPGQYVLFAMTDTGAGMDAEVKARALDPFFTTKPVGSGTGLGLSQVYGFVKQSGGHLRIYSELGEGTTIKLYLPRSRDETSARPRRVEDAIATGSETVLLVDDDEIVRATVASMLENLGYSVICACNGAEALAIVESTDRKIDLLFTDIVMPGPIGGRLLAERAAQLIPGLKVLFTSGYTENAVVHNGRLDPGVELLSKPYDRDKLAVRLRRVLDRTTSPIQTPLAQPDAGRSAES